MIQFGGPGAAVYSLAFSPDSSLLACGTKDGGVRLYDAGGGVAGEFAAGEGHPRRALAWSPDGEWLAFGDGPTLVEVRADGRTTLTHKFSVGADVSGLAYLSAPLLVVCDADRLGGFGRLYLWDTVRRVPRPVGHTPAPGGRAVAVHRETKLVAWVSAVKQANQLHWWAITSPDRASVPLGKPAAAVAVSPDGACVAAAVEWGVKLFAVTSRRPSGELTGHKGQVSGVAFTPDGRTLATASWDRTVRLWDVATRQEKARFALDIGPLTAVAASPDGTRLAVAGTDGPVVLIDAE